MQSYIEWIFQLAVLFSHNLETPSYVTRLVHIMRQDNWIFLSLLEEVLVTMKFKWVE